jgi:hypothetical protein
MHRLANSKAGDYHDNLASNMFMHWVEKKLLAYSKKLHPMAKMVLVAVNALYHHEQHIGGLALLTKTKSINMKESYGCNHVNVSLSLTCNLTP